MDTLKSEKSYSDGCLKTDDIEFLLKLKWSHIEN